MWFAGSHNGKSDLIVAGVVLSIVVLFVVLHVSIVL
jgi:hypothetical protein